MENNQKGAAPESPMRDKARKCLSPKETLVTTGSNVFFNGSKQAGFRDFEAKSLQWVYSVIRDGKLPLTEDEQAVSQQSSSMIDEFNSLATLASKVATAKEILAELEDQPGTNKLPSSENQYLLTEAKENLTTLKRAYEMKKKSLPVFCWSGTFEQGQRPKNDNLLQHSGRLQIDIDSLGLKQALEVRKLLASDPHIEAVFLSPSRLGVKAAMKIPICQNDDEHKQAFEAARRYIREKYNLIIDESCKDVRRLCFLSYDPQLVLNHDAVPLNTSEWSITEPPVTVVDKPADPTESTEDLFEDSPNDLTTVSAEHYLQQGLQQIRFASEGSRHRTYCKVAYSCGGLVSGGLLAREDTLKLLINAARKARPEDPADAERTVQQCFSEGEKKPYRPKVTSSTIKGNWHYLNTAPNEPQKLKPNLHNIVEWLSVVQRPIWYDEFHHRTMTVDEKGHHLEWDDELTLKLTKELQDFDLGWRGISDVIVDKAVQTYAYQDKRNELTDYLNSLQWDGVPRIDSWLIDYCGTVDNLYTREAGRCWLLAAVNRAYIPGTKFDHCLILQGKQGYFKSTVFSIIGGNWFCELKEFRGKEAQEKLLGKWIVEFAEMSVLKKADTETIKSFVTERADRFRPPYGKRARDFPRTCVFGGSTNEDEFLSDTTGNRRFWPIHIPNPIRINEFQQQRDQLLAEAVHLHKVGKSFLMSREAQKIAEREQEQVLSIDPWEETVRDYIAGRKEASVTIDQLIEHLQGEHDNKLQIHTGHRMRVGKVLQHLGWEKRRSTARDDKGKRSYAYWPGEAATALPNGATKNEENRPIETFQIDGLSHDSQPINNTHLTKLRDQGPQLQKELSRILENPAEKLNHRNIEQLELELDRALSKLISLGLPLKEAWVAIEQSTGNWKEACSKKESFQTAFGALSSLLSQKLLVLVG